MELLLLGTGGPPPDPQRSQPAQVVEVAGERILVDCGDGTLGRLLQAGISPADIETVILTHLHADHTVGLPGFLLAGWLRNRPHLRVFGPAGTADLLGRLLGFYRPEIEKKIRNGRSATGILDIPVTEFGPGWHLETDAYRIDVQPVIHSITTFALRIGAGGRTLVLGADTAYCADLVPFALGADLLLHEAYVAENPLDGQVAGLLDNLRRAHATPTEAGRIAQAAGVGQLVLNHLLPDADVAAIARQCRQAYSGPLTVGHDLLRIVV